MKELWRSIEQNAEDKSDLIKIGSLWKHQNKDGETFLSGSMGEAGCMVFLNKYKEEGKNHPDYNIYVAKKKKKERAGDVPF